MVRKFLEGKTCVENMWEHSATLKGTREQGPPPPGDSMKKIHSLPSNGIISLNNIFSYEQVSSIIIIYSTLNINP